MKAPLRSATLLFLAALLPQATVRAYEWNGSSGGDFSAPSGWTGPAPRAGALNEGDLYILNGDDAPLVYTEAQGATRFHCADFKIGNSARPGGALLMTGGELSIASRWAPMIGHNNNRTGTLTLTGGRLVIASRSDARPGERSLRIGNWRGSKTRGVLNITGGILEVNTPGDIELGGLVVGCDEARGEINITGGLIVVSSVFGTSFQPADQKASGRKGSGILTFGPGDGVFMQTDSRQLIFDAGGGDASHINFLSGSRGQLSLAGATRADFERWVLDGRIRIDGRQARPDEFQFLTLDTQGICQLAPRPR